jgi:hypothetical protein
MKHFLNGIRTATAVAAMVWAATAQAGLTTIFVSGDAENDINSELARPVVEARQSFMTAPQLQNVKNEGLESFAAGTAVNNLTLFGGAATVTTAGEVTNMVSDGAGGVTGRYNTTPGCDPINGCMFIETAGSLTVAFGGNYSAFAFYGTDFSDYNGVITIEILEVTADGSLQTVSGATSILDFTNTSSSGGTSSDGSTKSSNPDGSLMFWGFTDDTRGYAGVRINISQSNTGTSMDYVGFDDFVLGDFVATGGTVPEPASLALVGLSLVGLAAVRRRKAAVQA